MRPRIVRWWKVSPVGRYIVGYVTDCEREREGGKFGWAGGGGGADLPGRWALVGYVTDCKTVAGQVCLMAG